MSDISNEFASFSLSGATGDQPSANYKYINVPFGRYVVTVKLKPTNEFVGINEITLDKDFLSDAQRQGRAGYLDVDDFYKDQE